jgi:integration host factor subunit alpha
MLERVSAYSAGEGHIVASFENDEGAALTRQSIVRAASDRIEHLSRREIKRLVDSVIEEMTAALVRGETVKLHDFGSFVVRGKGHRSGRNPRTGERVPIEPRKVVVFKASPRFKEVMNDGPAATGCKRTPSGER